MNVIGKKSLVDSPCIGVCSTALGDEVCLGCGRTFDEVYRWNRLSPEEKKRINLRLFKDKNKETPHD